MQPSQPSSSTSPVDAILPAQQMVSYGLQHVLVLYAGAVAVPLILGAAMGLTSAQVVLLINANLRSILTMTKSNGAAFSLESFFAGEIGRAHV